MSSLSQSTINLRTEQITLCRITLKKKYDKDRRCYYIIDTLTN